MKNTTQDELREELLRAWRAYAWNREHQAEKLLEVVKILARDVLALADVSPTDPLLPAIVRGARSRAARMLADIGEAREHAH